MSTDNPGKPRNPDNKKDEDAVAFLQGLFELARNGGTGPLNVMLHAGVPLDIRTSKGESMLMLACSNGHIDTAHLLLEQGANPDLPDYQLKTPLMVAAMSNRVDLIDCLLEAGADQSLKNRDVQSALDLAKATKADEAVKRLSQETLI